MKLSILKVVFISTVCFGILFVSYKGIGAVKGAPLETSNPITGFVTEIFENVKRTIEKLWRMPDVLSDDPTVVDVPEEPPLPLDPNGTGSLDNGDQAPQQPEVNPPRPPRPPPPPPKPPDKPYWVQKGTYPEGKIRMTRYTVHNYTCKYYKTTPKGGEGLYDERGLERFTKRQERNLQVVWGECPEICGGKNIRP